MLVSLIVSSCIRFGLAARLAVFTSARKILQHFLGLRIGYKSGKTLLRTGHKAIGVPLFARRVSTRKYTVFRQTRRARCLLQTRHSPKALSQTLHARHAVVSGQTAETRGFQTMRARRAPRE